MLERDYQRRLKRVIEELFPGVLILKNDESYIQGIPDLTLLWEDRWAMLEVKASAKASLRPNQKTWIDNLNRMSFAAIIYPENEKEVLDALQQSWWS